ncbi:MAG: hypothetical protein JXA00_05945 [Candidatus Thermoplasmatota archaeon]|nr:hypothetical protein [Candidatus Thermoplasmatota archaeon]
MRKRRELVLFLRNQEAVSEEFTSLPGLAVVMIGFALFIVLIAHTYTAYEARSASISSYHTADVIATKLMNPECAFIDKGGCIDLVRLHSPFIQESLNETRKSYQRNGVDFMLRLRWANSSLDVPALPETTGNRIAVSRDVSIKLNDLETVAGKLTIITWSVQEA